MDARQQRQALRDRAERAFAKASPSAVLSSNRAIIGSRADLMGIDAEAARDALKNGREPTPLQQAALEQAIRLQRPSLICSPDVPPAPLDASAPLAAEWEAFRESVLPLQMSVARLERIDDPQPDLGTGRTPVGTGFLVAPGRLLTAAHVVEQLSSGTGRLERGQAVADFRGYYGVSGSDLRPICGVTAIDPELDLALIEFEVTEQDTARTALELDSGGIDVTSPIAVLGYPIDATLNRPALTSIIFGKQLGVKRIAVGEVIGRQERSFDHDCSVVGGNSGSPILLLKNGTVCGVHIGGAALSRNKAVPGAAARRFVSQTLQRSATSPSVHSRSIARSPGIAEWLSRLREIDPLVASEIQATADTWSIPESAGEAEDNFALETIVLTQGRPVLDIRNSAAVIELAEIESQIWKDRLQASAAALAPSIPAVGRIEVANHPSGNRFLGTGWLVRDNYVVTNRHVAELFVREQGAEIVFRSGIDGAPMAASIDFLQEFGHEQGLRFSIFRVAHLEQGGGPDLAFLRIEPLKNQELPSPVKLATGSARVGDQVAVIGYPARDPSFPNPELMDRIFRNRYDRKRLAPGLVMGVSESELLHDCTTLGGNSGAEVVSLTTGEAIALHFAGTLFSRNHAIPAGVVASRLDEVRRRRSPRKSTSPGTSRGSQNRPGPASPPATSEGGIPIQIQIEIGNITWH